MNPTKVMNGIEVYGEDILPYLEIFLEKPEVADEIGKDTVVIFAETEYNGKYLQDFYGIDFLLELLAKNPKKSVLCLSTLPSDFVRKHNYRIDILGNYPNTAFLDVLSIENEDVAESVRKARESRDVTFPKEKRIEALAKFGKDIIARLVHDLKVDDPKNPEGEEIRIVDKVLSEARNTFPSLKNMWDDEVIDFIYAANSQREEVMKGEKISGVYCDVEGTLLIDGVLNKGLFEDLKEYPENEVTLWTDGDVDSLQNKLNDLDIPFPLRSKSAFAGATAMLVIDDLDEMTFTARTKIRASEFIQVKK